MPAPSDLVHQTTTTTGTGALDLESANGKRTFVTAFGTGGTNTFDYYISNRDAEEWERGTGHESAGTLVRDTVIASSNSNNAVDFSAGTKDVTNDVPAATQVRGPATSTDNAVARFDGTNVNLLQSSAFVVDDSGHVTSFGGNLAFPASQAASAGANVLDDYEEGTWTPVLTFATPGDLSVAYSVQVGFYTKIGRLVTATFVINTSAFTHTTASGQCNITGLPFTSQNTSNWFASGPLVWQGITKANYTHVNGRVSANSTTVNAVISGSGQTVAVVAAADMPTGGSVVLQGTISYVTST